jgi:hypothetical protein
VLTIYSYQDYTILRVMEMNGSNRAKAEDHKRAYKVWKDQALDTFGYFPIFQPFRETFLLRNLSGSSVKLYIYLGLASGNNTGETWVKIDTIASYFNKTPRAISKWIKELEDVKLIERYQMEINGVAHSFLIPYGANFIDDPLSIQKGKLKFGRTNYE